MVSPVSPARMVSPVSAPRAFLRTQNATSNERGVTFYLSLFVPALLDHPRAQEVDVSPLESSNHGGAFDYDTLGVRINADRHLVRGKVVAGHRAKENPSLCLVSVCQWKLAARHAYDNRHKAKPRIQFVAQIVQVNQAICVWPSTAVHKRDHTPKQVCCQEAIFWQVSSVFLLRKNRAKCFSGCPRFGPQ